MIIDCQFDNHCNILLIHCISVCCFSDIPLPSMTAKLSSSTAAVPIVKDPNVFSIDDLVVLRTLGRGASGVVYLTLHVPTLTLVAQKVSALCIFI